MSEEWVSAESEMGVAIMSYDRYEDEYHLTPDGWISGSSYFYGKSRQEAAPPPTRVLTLLREVRQSSGYSREEVSYSEVWRTQCDSAREIAELSARFGATPASRTKTLPDEWAKRILRKS